MVCLPLSSDVFIGPYTIGLQDNYITSIDHAKQMYGVEYQANAVQALLWGEYKREVGDGVQLALLFGVLLLGLLGFWRRRVRTAAVLWAALCGGWVLLCMGMYQAGWVLHVLWIPIGTTVLFAGSLAVNYIQAAAERRQVTNTFKRYVAPEIVNELLKEGTEALGLGGKLSTIAVLFVDVRGFTTMSEMLESPQVVEILNQYLTLIADCILKNEGTLDKFVGDVAMAFWGAPLPQEDYIMQAVQAAADMVNGSKALSEELMAQFGRTVSFGIGVHVGEAVVGNIGSPQRMDYTAIGDTVNTSARLEANAPGGTIYISRAVADALEGLEVPVRVQTAIAMQAIAEPYIRSRAVRHMEKGRVVIFGCGTGSPFFSTDTAAALRAAEVGADIVLKATMVDGVYDKDPHKFPDAKRYDVVSFSQVLEQNLSVMDMTAASLCRDNGVPILVFDLSDPENICRAVCGEHIGTIVKEV